MLSKEDTKREMQMKIECENKSEIQNGTQGGIDKETRKGSKARLKVGFDFWKLIFRDRWAPRHREMLVLKP